MIESTLIFSYDGYYSAIKKHIFEEYLIIRESSYDKRERQFRKLSIQKDLIFRVFIFLVFWLPFAELAVVFVVNWGHISVITLVLCVRHSCGRADTATLLSPSPKPQWLYYQAIPFPHCPPHQLCSPGHISLGPAPASVVFQTRSSWKSRWGQTKAKHVVLGIALICICNPFFSRGTSRIKYPLSPRTVQCWRLKSSPKVLPEVWPPPLPFLCSSLSLV